MKKLTFLGYYGFGNFGDELFVAASLLAADRYWPGYQTHVNSPELDGLPIAGRYQSPKYLKKNFSRIDLTGKSLRFITLLRTLSISDLVAFAGGSTLSDILESPTISLIESLGRLRRINTAGIGVSVGPFRTLADEKACRQFIEKFSFLALRDHESYQIVKGMNLPFEAVLARDLAGVLPLFLPVPQVRKRSRLGISLCNYERYKGGDISLEERRNLAIIEGIRDFVRRNNVQVSIFVLNSHYLYGDWEISNRLARLLRDDHVDVVIETLGSGPLHLWEKIGQCRAVFSVRLHGAISAYLQDVPFALVEYHRKCSDFLDDVQQSLSNRLMHDWGQTQVYDVLNSIYNERKMPAMPVDDYAAHALLNFTRAPWARSSSNCA